MFRFAKIAKVWHTSGCRLQGVVALEHFALGTFNIFQHFSHLRHLHLLTSGLNPPQRSLEHRFLPLSAAPELTPSTVLHIFPSPCNVAGLLWSQFGR